MGEHIADLAVEGLGVFLTVEITRSFSPSRPGVTEPMKNLPGVVLAPGLSIGQRDTGPAEIFLSQNIGRYLRPCRRNDYFLLLKNELTIGISDLRASFIPIDTASDPKTVLDILVEAKPELILMDLYMPECNGTELLSIIRQQEVFVGIPIVFLSVEEDKQKKLDAIRYGGDDFLTKPVDPEYLITSISNRVSRTRNMRFFMERDSLTGLLNHSNLREHLTREILRATRAQSNLCFAMIDLDHFKLVNDTHGHLIGDKVLKSLSRMLQERLRRTDIIGRYGGEEFGVILLNTDGNNGERILNEVRNNFSRIHHQAEDEEFFVTFSCGIACFSAFQDARSITNAADRALYEAKEGGRNRVALAGS